MKIIQYYMILDKIGPQITRRGRKLHEVFHFILLPVIIDHWQHVNIAAGKNLFFPVINSYWKQILTQPLIHGYNISFDGNWSTMVFWSTRPLPLRRFKRQSRHLRLAVWANTAFRSLFVRALEGRTS